MISYLDTSAALKLLIAEAESDALATYLQAPGSAGSERVLAASWLLHTELHCAANRHPEDVALDSVRVVLETLSLIDLTRGDLLTAGTLPGQLRSPDALHLAVALRVGADEMVTYDAKLASAATAAGLPVAQPGRLAEVLDRAARRAEQAPYSAVGAIDEARREREGHLSPRRR